MRYAIDLGDGERRVVEVRERPDLGEGVLETQVADVAGWEPMRLRRGPGNEFVADVGGRIFRGLYDRTPAGLVLHLGGARREVAVERDAGATAGVGRSARARAA